MDVSIIIVNWNTRQITCDCLTSIFSQPSTRQFEVIVVDNASSDNFVAAIKKCFPQVTLVENDQNRGFAAANNQAIGLARGRYVLLLNSDTVVLDRAIDKAVAFANEHPDVGVLGCRVLNPDGSVQPTCFMYPSVLNMFLFATYLNKLFPKSRFFGRERMTWWKRDDGREVEVVTGCFMLVRREAINHVGLMDEGFFMYGEETDWCFRFRKAGWKIVFTPCAEIIHLGGASSSREANEMTLQNKAGVLQFLDKHRSRSAYVAACGLMLMFLLLRTPFWLTRTVWPPSGRRQAWSRVVVYARGIRRLRWGWRGLRNKVGRCNMISSTDVWRK